MNLKIVKFSSFVFSLILLFTSCLPSKFVTVKNEMQALDKNKEVQVLGLEVDEPQAATVVGFIKIGDTGFSTDCGWNKVISIAKEEARKIGGNIVKITAHKPPSIWGSSCHIIEATIFNSEIINYDINNNPLAEEIGVITEKPKEQKNNYDKLQIGAFGGFSYLTAGIAKSVPQDLHDYMKELKSGFHFGLVADYNTSRNVAFGLYYSFFKTSNSTDIFEMDEVTGSIIRNGKLSDNIKVSLIAPTYTYKYFTNNKLQIAASIGLGYLIYRNDAMLFEPFSLQSSTVGFMAALNGQYKIAKSLGVNLRVGKIGGTLNHYQYRDAYGSQTIKLQKDSYESVNRLDVSLGLRWTIFY